MPLPTFGRRSFNFAKYQNQEIRCITKGASIFFFFFKSVLSRCSVNFFSHQSRAKIKPPKSHTGRQTFLLPHAQFLLDFKANCTGTQKNPGRLTSLCYAWYFLCDLKKALWLSISYVLSGFFRKAQETQAKSHPEKAEASVPYLNVLAERYSSGWLWPKVQAQQTSVL